MKNLTFIIVLLVGFSCSKDDSTTTEPGFDVVSFLKNPYSLDVNNAIIISKQGVTFSGDPHLKAEGISKKDEIKTIKVNNIDVPKGRYGSFYKPFVENPELNNVNEFEIQVDDKYKRIPNIFMKLKGFDKYEQKVKAGMKLEWEYKGPNRPIIIVTVQELPWDRPPKKEYVYEYFIVKGGNSFVLPEKAFERLKTGDLLKIAVTAAYTTKSDDIQYTSLEISGSNYLILEK